MNCLEFTSTSNTESWDVNYNELTSWYMKVLYYEVSVLTNVKLEILKDLKLFICCVWLLCLPYFTLVGAKC